jgi:hypothetical protein
LRFSPSQAAANQLTKVAHCARQGTVQGVRVGQKRSRGKRSGKQPKLTGNQRSGGERAEAE